MMKNLEILKKEEEISPPKFEDETPRRFLASCSSLMTETNPFEMSLSLPPITNLPPQADFKDFNVNNENSEPNDFPQKVVLSQKSEVPTDSINTNNMTDAEKRKATLENNRKAASRCRQKRKEKILSMQEGIVTLSKDNVQLEELSKNLKLEIQELKILLLENKNCQVALKMGMDIKKIEAIV
ncbi:hypothetical protein HK099_005596 [Clydaea vesicula]|uniref:BZIP domain-containing protein n=1 Tax=Clydaea vesicula TaxID=447962 RepID=A0AAD5XUU5_9FUNG|nr:hypothetical protein HK099_005596 [Clydaea vesicula]